MKTSEYDEFKRQCEDHIIKQSSDEKLITSARDFFLRSFQYKYSYNYEFLGRPIIQYPQDIVAMQEIIWNIRPDLIIETGIAHGGSLIYYASMLALLDMSDAIEAGTTINPKHSKRKVIGVDIDIRYHNRIAIEAHQMSSRISMFEGSSIDPKVVSRIAEIAASHKTVIVCLDSNHTHEHVLAELDAYSPLTTIGSYCIVFDTIIEHMPKEAFVDRPWGPGNNPGTAVNDFLASNTNFVVDQDISNKLLITVSPAGYLKRIR